MPSPKFRVRTCALAIAPVFLFAATGPPVTAPARVKAASVLNAAPPAPPDGSYVYAISRNGTERGKTTVTVFRRNDAANIETNESGYAEAARADVVAAFRYADLSTESYVGTYRAPFLRGSPLGAGPSKGTRGGFNAPVTVRFRFDKATASATIDGVAGNRVWSAPGAASAALPSAVGSASPGTVAPAVLGASAPHITTRFVIDAPFMTGVMFVPAYRHRSGSAVLAPIGEAFDEGTDIAPERIVTKPPHFPKTPKTDIAVQIGDIGTVWFDRANYIVHEAHFDKLNFDVDLIAYSRSPLAAEPPPADGATPKPHVASRSIGVTSADGTKLAAVLNLPPDGKPQAPAIVFVPPGPGTDRNFAGDGPNPMYPELALAFAQRGYAVVRYDARPTATWEQSLADIEAVIDAAGQQDAVDSSRIYLLGYGVGADLALVASERSDVSLGGVVALAPSVLAYLECARRTDASTKGTFFKTAAAHDPAALADRARVPLFVLHPGVPACGETKDETGAYDDKLHAANGRATIITASDLSSHFGGLYDADSKIDTQEFFPYRFDASTAGAIGDWLDNPKDATNAGTGGKAPAGSAVRPHAPPPPPPPITNPEMNGEMPNPHATADRNVSPGVVLPSGMTPPPIEVETSTAAPTPVPVATPMPGAATPAPAPTKTP